MEQERLRKIGEQLYHMHTGRGMKRYVVLLGRAYLHKSKMEELFAFFDATPLRQRLLAGEGALIEQTTRGFFYKDSTYAERMNLVQHHIEALEELMQPQVLEQIYVEHRKITLWEDTYEDKPLKLVLHFNAGQRKEGCLSLCLCWGEDIFLYQIVFWLSLDSEGRRCLYIGALQGHPKADDTIKELTKKYFGYRTKNLIFYGVRVVAKVWGCHHIVAVSNKGYYAMNHVRLDRKLKTDFGSFWAEAGGTPCQDERFYEIPLEEYRKEMSELKPSKRAQHRKRFAFLDALAAQMESKLAQLGRN